MNNLQMNPLKMPSQMTPLPQSFYNRPTLKVAQGLIGQFLVREFEDGSKLFSKITEVEAYCGPRDKASHASRGMTERTKIMFGPAGHWYVYLIYGMYYCLNVVTEKVGYPAAVLIRGVEISGSQKIKTDGPGKICQKFEIDKFFNNKPAFKKPLYIAKGETISKSKILSGPRIGVDYAGPYKNKPWRFFIVHSK